MRNLHSFIVFLLFHRLLLNLFFHVVIFLYLMDNETSRVRLEPWRTPRPLRPARARGTGAGPSVAGR